MVRSPRKPDGASGTRELIAKLQGGTSKHIDGDVADPLASRPFQALVQLSRAAPDGSDGSLRVLPGFHAAALRYFQLAGLPPPAGGFTPLTPEYHADLLPAELWMPARRMPPKWSKLHAKKRLPAPSSAPAARCRQGLVSALRKLASELRAELGDGLPPQPGDYVIWDPRLPHSTGEADEYNMHDAPRQVAAVLVVAVGGLMRGRAGIDA